MAAKKKTTVQQDCCSGTCCKVDSIVTVDERGQILGEGRYQGWGQAGFDVLGKGREGVLLYADQSGSTGGNGEGCAGTAGEGNILGLFR